MGLWLRIKVGWCVCVCLGVFKGKKVGREELVG